jgi:hypothetical protein
MTTAAKNAKNAKEITKYIVVVLLLAVLSLAFYSTAQALAGYDLSWWTVDGGGSVNLESGGYSLSATIGQPDAGTLSNGGYSLGGGFWAGALAERKVFFPLINR